MTYKSKWQRDHPPIRFYSESVEWLEELARDAAARSLSLGDYIKQVLSARRIIEQQAHVFVDQAPTGITCVHCHNFIPESYIEKIRVLREFRAPDLSARATASGPAPPPNPTATSGDPPLISGAENLPPGVQATAVHSLLV